MIKWLFVVVKIIISKFSDFINSLLFIEKNYEIVFSSNYLHLIKFMNVKIKKSNYQIFISGNTLFENLLLIKEQILALAGNLNECIYLINYKT